MNFEYIQSTWLALHQEAQIKSPQTETEYLALLEVMDNLTSQYALDNPIWGGLIRLIASYLLEYENQFDSWAKTPPTSRDVLSSLMRNRQISQRQLEQAGVAAQSTLSQILSGKRGISKRVAKKLGAYFGVSPVVFL
jgi:HTH-type transcriptional regulator / antitoxin HigA